MQAALRIRHQNEKQSAILDAQGALICDMQGEITLLKRQLAEHGRVRSLDGDFQHSYFQEVRHRSWARAHRLVVLVAVEIVAAAGVWLWLLLRAP